jgi:hypothetical protein
VRGGVYNEAVTIPTSGSAAGGYITFQSYSGETAIVDGSTLTVPNTTSGLFTLQDKSYIRLIGFEIRNYKTSKSSALGYVPAGIYIQGAGDHIEIRNNRIHDIQTLYQPPSIPALGVAGAFGLAVYGTNATASISNLTIDGNELYNLMTGSSESLVLNGNVQNCSITNNIIYNNSNIGIDAIGFQGTSADPATDQARNGVISGNLVYNITSVGNVAYGPNAVANGIYVDGGTGIIIERNSVHNVDIGIELASEHSGRFTSNVIARSNLVFFSHTVGFSIGGYAATVGGTRNCSIVNNTLFENDTSLTGSGEFQIQYSNSGANNLFENNIVYAGSQGLLINSIYPNSSAQLGAVDHNLYFAAGGASVSWTWNGTSYLTFASYLAATGGKEAGSRFADPQFFSLGNPNVTPPIIPDLHVQSTSPAVNAGINLGASVVGTLDFAGNPRVQGANIDIGAYEQ